jgi:hypothetical protein
VAQHKQLGVALPPDLRARLEDASAAGGHSLADEIRQRVQRTFEQDDFHARHPDLVELLSKIEQLTILAERTTERRWNKDPATTYVLKLAVAALLDRYGATEITEVTTFPGGLLSGSSNPSHIAAAMEVLVDFQTREGRGWPFLKQLRASLDALRRTQREGEKP